MPFWAASGKRAWGISSARGWATPLHASSLRAARHHGLRGQDWRSGHQRGSRQGTRQGGSRRARRGGGPRVSDEPCDPGRCDPSREQCRGPTRGDPPEAVRRRGALRCPGGHRELDSGEPSREHPCRRGPRRCVGARRSNRRVGNLGARLPSSPRTPDLARPTRVSDPARVTVLQEIV